MSKISQLHVELSEQAAELGFESLGEAEQAGYGVDWENAKLIKVEDEQDKAHEAWLKERDEVLKGLEILLKVEKYSEKILGDGYIDLGESERINRAIKFIKEQCHD